MGAIGDLIFLKAMEQALISHMTSLQATWIRNSLQRALGTIEIDIRKFTNNFVYEYPSIEFLAQYCHTIATGGVLPSTDNPNQKIELMNQMVQRYSGGFHTSSEPGTSIQSPLREKVVLLTGSTGALGAHILIELLGLREVRKVFAINRKHSDRDILTRQKEALQKLGFQDQSESLSRRVVLLEGDIGIDNMGIDESLYSEV